MRPFVLALALACTAAAQPRLVPQLGHTGRVWDAAFSPDGRYVATGGDDGAAHVWDAATGADLAQVGGHDGTVHTVAFTPGGHLLTAGYDGARLWDVAARRAVRAFDGPVDVARLGPDGARLLLVGETAALVDPATGAAQATLDGARAAGAWAFTFDRDGRRVAAVRGATPASDSVAVRVWDAETGAVLRAWATPDPGGHRIHAARFTPDGRLVAFYALGGARAWDPATGDETPLAPPLADAYDARFSADGARVGLQVGRPTPDGYDDLTAEVWDLAAGRAVFAPSWAEVGGVHGSYSVVGVRLRADGARALTIDEGGRAALWDVDRGTPLAELGPHVRQGYRAEFTASGRALVAEHFWRLDTGDADPLPVEALSRAVADRALVTTAEGGVRVLDADGAALLEVATEPYPAAALSADGRTLAVSLGGDRAAIEVWDVDAGERRAAFAAPSGRRPDMLALRPDGAALLVRSAGPPAADGSATASYHVLRTDDGSVAVTVTEGAPARDVPTEARFSPDGGRVAFFTPLGDGPTTLWETETAEVQRLPGAPAPFTNPAGPFSPDGERLVLAARDTVRVIAAATGEVLTTVTLPAVVTDGVPWAPSAVTAAFSPDGRRLLTVDGESVGIIEYRSTARVWDAATGAELLVLTGYQGVSVETAAWSPDGRHIATVSVDGTVQIRDAATGAERAALFAFADGTWAAVDAEGRYDASNGGDVDGLVWVVEGPGGPEPLRLAQLKARYYDPGLVAKHLGFNDEPLRDVAAFRTRGVALAPAVAIAEAAPDAVAARVTDRGGGIGPVAVFVNGTRVVEDARPDAFDPATGALEIAVDLGPFRRLLVPDTLNTVAVAATNAEGSLTSRRVSADVFVPAARGTDEEAPADADAYDPHLWAVLVGVGEYVGDALDLRFAGADAADVAAALGVAAPRLFGPERTHVTLLTTEPGGDGPPTRDAILGALAEAAERADARDVLLVYLAGHGVVHGGADGDFYFLTRDAATGDLADAAVRAAVAVSSAELEARLAVVPALKRVLILDTCASGRVVEQLSARRDVPGAQVRSLDRLKDHTGTFVLAGSAADAVSYEATQYGQGLLTWSLLEGLRLAADADDHAVDVLAWFDHAQRRVPELARSIGGVQRPELVMPAGRGSYPVGRVLPEDQARIPLQTPRPVVLRASFQDEATFGDPLELTRAVNAALRAASARGDRPPLVYVDAEGYPEAYRLAGRYAVADGVARVDVRLLRAGAVAGAFAAEGPAGDPAALAARLVAAAEAALPAE